MIDRRQIVVLAMIAAVTVALTGAVGGVAGSEQDGYVVEQGDQCVPVSPITGDDTAQEFYDYRTTSTYTYSSHGTQEYQEDDTSVLMLYEGSDGLSMVIVHDKLHQNASNGTDGGSASFEVTNLPADGEWTVEDDDYNHSGGTTDNFDHGETESDLHWTWSEGRTDGAVFTGLGNDSRVEINASWNEDAKLSDAHNGTYNGTIENWQVVTATDSGDGFERHTLDSLNESVTVQAGSCGSEGPSEPSEEAFFNVSITDTNDPVEDGEPLQVTAEIENTGNAEGTQDIRFLFNDSVEAVEENVTLTGGENTTVTFTFDTADAVPGEYDTEVHSDDDADGSTVTIQESSEEASFAVSITDTNEPVEQGETLDVTAEIVNTGELEDTQDVEFGLDGEIVAVEENVTLAGGESTTLTVTHDTSGIAGEHDAEVRSDDDSDTRTITVSEPSEEAFFAIETVDTNLSITAGETVTVNIEVTNTGETTATKRVWFELGEILKDEKQIELAPGETKTVELTWNSGTWHADEWTLTAATEDDVQESAVTIEEPSSSSTESGTSDDTSETDSADETTENEADEEGDESGESGTSTATPTETPRSTDSSTENSTSDGSTTTAEDEDTEPTAAPDNARIDESVPGFGPVPALVALLAMAGFLVSRRD